MPPFSPSPNPSSASPLLSWTRLSGSDLLNINSFLATHTVVLTRPINHLPGLLAEAHVSDRFSAPLRVSSSWPSTACLYWCVLYCSSGSHNTCTFSNLLPTVKNQEFCMKFSIFNFSRYRRPGLSEETAPPRVQIWETVIKVPTFFLKTPACPEYRIRHPTILWPELNWPTWKASLYPQILPFKGKRCYCMEEAGEERLRGYFTLDNRRKAGSGEDKMFFSLSNQ